MQSTKKWIQNFGIIIRLLQRLTKDVEWRCIKSENFIFHLMKKFVATAGAFFGWDLKFFIKFYGNVSNIGAKCLVMQLQDGERKFIIYDFFIFNRAKKHYDIYKRELLAMVIFCCKYKYMVQAGKKIHNLY